MRSKITFLLAIVLVSYLAAHFAVQRLLISPMFTKLERDEAIKNVDRCISALDREVELLDRFTNDWASWDDSSDFVSNLNETFTKVNLSSEVFRLNKLNFIYFINKDLEPVWHRYIDEANQPLTSHILPSSTWPKDHALVLPIKNMGSISGLLTDGDRILMLSSRPILNSEGKGPSNGILVMGRHLDQAGLKRLSQQTRVTLQVWPLGSEAFPEKNGVLDKLTAEKPYLIREASDSFLHVFSLYQGLAGQPVLLLQVGVPRNITSRVRKAMDLALVSVLVAGLGLLFALYLALRGAVVEPLLNLTQQVDQAGSEGFQVNLNILKRTDELGTLARSFSGLLGELAEDRKHLAVQSYHSGKAEVAGNLLHNIRNGLHPIAAFTDLLLADVRDAPLLELEKAMHELKGKQMNPSRRAQLEEFRDLSTSDLIRMLREAEDSLIKMLGHTKQVIQTANDHKQNPAQQKREQVNLLDVFQDAFKQLPPELIESVDLRFHASMNSCPLLSTARLQLQQVLTNLLLFSPLPAPEEQFIEVSWEPGNHEFMQWIVLEIVHVRLSLKPTDLERLFERGYTCCRVVPDQGMHWCANTVNSMGGRLQVSQAVGGITFHLMFSVDTEAGSKV